MKRINHIFPFLFFLILTANAQPDLNIGGLVSKRINSIDAGQLITITGFGSDESGSHLKIIPLGKEDRIGFSSIKNIQFTSDNIVSFWKIQALKGDVYANLAKNGYQYKIRRQMEEDALDVIDYYVSKDLLFDDNYLESYLYGLVLRLFPDNMNDGRPGVINVKIIKDLAPNAWVYPNGTLFISTGLISTINTEEELLGILAHEISHFVLDHSIHNYNKAVQRQKRAEFWAGVATIAGAVADGYISSKNQNYSPGAITMMTSVLAYSIAESINERLGLKFSREQETEADKCAVEVMRYLKIKTTALSSAFSKLKKYFINSGNYLALSGEGTHPAIDERIKLIGFEGELGPDKSYDKTVSFVNTYTSKVEFYNRHFTSSIALINRNISQLVATEEDYILLAKSYLYSFNTEAKNLEALSFINKAKELNALPCLDMFKTEALILLRIGKREEAKNALMKYKSLLESQLTSKVQMKTSEDVYNCNSYLCRELEWVNKMIYKIKHI
jgi:Zn-dependent protease with chaperone function